ncbi:MAG: ATP-grasp domain-containing protein [Candidatus Parcubacteria bacterium]|nr:ATP-grasp domain-containing protein [Candidatus Parcubacteria bacterium]
MAINNGKINKKVLFTNAGTTAAQNAIKYNLDKIAGIYGVDMDKFCYAKKILKNRFYKVPAILDWVNYKRELLKICKRNKIDLIVPCSNDEELLLLAKERRDFEEIGTGILLPDYKAVKLADDKVACNKYVSDLGVKIPEFYLADELPENPIFPLIMKNRRGGGSENMAIIRDKKDMDYYRAKEGVIFQKFIQGPEYSVDIVLDNSSKIIAGVVRKRLAAKAGICTKAEITKDKKLLGFAQKIAKAMRLIGPANMQFINGYFIEINPRLPGGLGLDMKAGFNMALLAVKSFFNIPISKEEKQFKNIKVLRIWEEVII